MARERRPLFRVHFVVLGAALTAVVALSGLYFLRKIYEVARAHHEWFVLGFLGLVSVWTYWAVWTVVRWRVERELEVAPGEEGSPWG